jgi:excisionase family DNA binding protein
MERLLVSVEEAAELLGIGRSTLYDLLRVDAVASVHIGRSRRIPVDALQEYIRQLQAADVGQRASALR